MFDTKSNPEFNTLVIGIDGSYNVKFISSNNTKNIYEAVYDINGNLLTENDDYGENMGTYNYASSSSSSYMHSKLDVATYNKWGNTINDNYHTSTPNDNYEMFSAESYYTDVCNRIGTSFEYLVANDFSIV